MRRAFVLLWVAACGSSAPATTAPSAADVDAASDASTSNPGPDANAPSSTDANNGSGEAAGPACALEKSGAFTDAISAIVTVMGSGGNAGSGALQVPTVAARDAFATQVVSVLNGDEQAACSFPPSYRLLHLFDPHAGTLRVIAELDASGAPAPILYWGTYAAPAVVPAHGRLLAVEAPHPLFDTNTEIQAADAFVQASARYYLLAGAHRCADSPASGCSGTTTACGATESYRISDAAHTEALPFHAVHAALSRGLPSLLFLQLHGNVEACPDALVSDDSGSWSDAGLAGSLASALAARGVSVGQCGAGYPTPACNLCGLDNVQARQTAGSASACTASAPAAGYGRFVHVEQQPGLRQSPGAGVVGYQPMIDALLAALPPQ